MKAFFVLCGVVLFAAGGFAAPQYVDCSNGCPDPPGPTKLCPDFVNDCCTPVMCSGYQGVPFPGDCSKFCLCNTGGAVEMDCASGTVFNPSLNLCVWPWESTCSNSDPFCCGSVAPTTPKPCTTTTAPCTTTTSPCTTTTTPCPTTTTPCTTTTTPCPTTTTPCTTTTTPCPTTTTPCPTTTTPCTTTTTPCTTTTTPCTTTTSPCTTTTAPCTTTTAPCVTDPPRPLVRCPDFVNKCCTPDKCNQAVGVPFPGNCSKFCKCDNGGAIEFDCASGTVFDPVLGVCVWPRDSTCSNSDPYPTCCDN